MIHTPPPPPPAPPPPRLYIQRYQLLTEKQFPATCPPNESDYTVHYVSNAGYGGALITLLEQFIYNYATTPEKVVH